jgi:hypothetical protein
MPAHPPLLSPAHLLLTPNVNMGNPTSQPSFFVYISRTLVNPCWKPRMIRKYWWLVVFAITVFLFDALLMQWIELISTETDKCRNMNSVNPLKLINCEDLD